MRPGSGLRAVKAMSSASIARLAIEMVGERPADQGVENDGQVDKLSRQPDISDVGDPDLIEPGWDASTRQMATMGNSCRLLVV